MKETVTLLNGFARSTQDFRDLTKHISALGIETLPIELMGAPRYYEQKGMRPTPFSFLDQVSEIFTIWNKKNIKKTHLLGISYGGVLAQTLFYHHPQYISSLILISTSNKREYIKKEMPLNPHIPLESIIEHLLSYISKENQKSYQPVIHSMAKNFLHTLNDPNAQRGLTYKRENFISMLSYLQLQAYQSLKKKELLIIHGNMDDVIDVKAANDMYQHLGKGGGSVALHPKAGHMLLLEDPVWLKNTILDFLSKISNQSTHTLHL